MRMVFGRYMPYNSVLHRMDPRLKLFMIIALIVSVFFPVGFTGFALVGATILLMYVISKLSFRMLFKLFTPIFLIFIVLLFINFFMLKPSDSVYEAQQITELSGGGELFNNKEWGYVVHWKFLWISEKAVYKSIYMTTRIFMMITLTTILTGTTQPLELTLAIEDLLFPLKLIGIPVHIFSQMISIALRMIPTLIDEAGRIMKAQASRGIDIKNGHGKDKIKALTSLIIPLLVSCFQKAEDLAYAMDSRGYDPHGKRTRYRQVKFKIIDIFIFVFCIGIAATLFAYPHVEALSNIKIPRIDYIIFSK